MNILFRFLFRICVYFIGWFAWYKIVQIRDPKTLVQLGHQHLHNQHFDWALIAYRRALRINQRIHGDRYLPNADCLIGLASALRFLDKTEQAEAACWQAYDLVTSASDEPNPDTRIIMNQLGWVYIDKGMLSKAEESFERALDQLAKVREPCVSRSVASLCGLAWIREAEGDREGAVPFYARALELQDQLPDSDNSDHSYCFFHYAELCFELERYEEAEPLYLRALEFCEKWFGHDNVNTDRALIMYMVNLAMQLKKDELFATAAKYGITDETRSKWTIKYSDYPRMNEGIELLSDLLNGNP